MNELGLHPAARLYRRSRVLKSGSNLLLGRWSLDVFDRFVVIGCADMSDSFADVMNALKAESAVLFHVHRHAGAVDYILKRSEQ